MSSLFLSCTYTFMRTHIVHMYSVHHILHRILYIVPNPQPAKVRQRFVVRPKTKHIICMKSIPGFVEESKDYVDSAYLTSSTSWVESSFLQSRHQTDYLSQSMDLTRRLRPSSAPQRRNTYGAEFMISTPDLSIYSEPGPLEFFGSNKLSIRGTYWLYGMLGVDVAVYNPLASY